MRRVLDLFSGIGGFTLGLEATGGFRTLAFVEKDPFCQQVLQKHWPRVPVYPDVRDISVPCGSFHTICGGFPCQDVSVANQRLGPTKSLLGDRSGMWFEFSRIIQEAHPKWVIIENVDALRNRGLSIILQFLSEVGYDAEWHVIPASLVGLPHRRDRLWIVANAHSDRPQGVSPFPLERLARLQRGPHCRSFEDWVRSAHPPEPYLCRSYNGIPFGVDRCKAIGNAVVPQIPYEIGMAILEAERRL